MGGAAGRSHDGRIPPGMRDDGARWGHRLRGDVGRPRDHGERGHHRRPDAGGRDATGLENHDVIVSAVRLLQMRVVVRMIRLMHDGHAGRQNDRRERRQGRGQLAELRQERHPSILRPNAESVNRRGYALAAVTTDAVAQIASRGPQEPASTLERPAAPGAVA